MNVQLYSNLSQADSEQSQARYHHNFVGGLLLFVSAFCLTRVFHASRSWSVLNQS